MRYALLFALVLATAMMLGGCGNNKTVRGPEYYRKQLSKDLHTPMETKGEVDNRVAHTLIMNARKLNAEWMRIWLIDHPSRSLGAPTPYE